MVPVMVVILRSWGTVYTLTSLISTDDITSCVHPSDILRSLLSILGVLQVREGGREEGGEKVEDEVRCKGGKV